MKIKNVSPVGDLDIPLLRRIVLADEVVDVSTEQAVILLEQRVNYAPADEEADNLAAQLLAQPAPEGEDQ